MRWASRVGQKLHPLAEPRSARDQPMVQAECRERAYSSYAEATPIDAERKREPEGQPRRARGDDEASVARSAARGAYRHHHSTQHYEAQQLKHDVAYRLYADNQKVPLRGIKRLRRISSRYFRGGLEEQRPHPLKQWPLGTDVISVCRQENVADCGRLGLGGRWCRVIVWGRWPGRLA